MTNFNQISKKYYRRAKHSCPLSHREKQHFLAELKCTMQTVYAEHPEISSYEELIESLGTPEQQALDFANTLSVDERNASIRRECRIRWCTILVAGALLFTGAVKSVSTIISVYVNTRTTVTVTTVVVDEPEADSSNDTDMVYNR